MRIVLVSPFLAERTALEALLGSDGHHVTAVATRAEAVAVACRTRPDVVIADAQVVGHDGRALLAVLAGCRLHPRVIFLCPRASGDGDRHGFVCLRKPIDLEKLRSCLTPQASAA